MTDGRFEFGIGAGWMTTDYEQSGIPMDPPSVRIARLAESLEIMRAMWATGTRHVQRASTTDVPDASAVTAAADARRARPGHRRRQPAHPHAGRAPRRDRQHRAQPGGRPHRTRGGGRVRRREVRATACAGCARRRGSAPTTSSSSAGRWPCRSCRTRDEVVRVAGARCSTSRPDSCGPRPLALIGTVAEIVDTLRKRREELGFSYIVVHEAEMEALAPVIAELAGT